MKTLEKGTGQQGWTRDVTCTGKGNGDGGCRAKLLVEQDDLFRTSSSSMGETDHYVTMRYHECGVLTDINNVPYNIERNLLDVAAWCNARGLTWYNGAITPLPRHR